MTEINRPGSVNQAVAAMLYSSRPAPPEKVPLGVLLPPLYDGVRTI
jgi:hypothetical protein